MNDIEERWERLKLIEEEALNIELGDDILEEQNYKGDLSLVGKFLQVKAISSVSWMEGYGSLTTDDWLLPPLGVCFRHGCCSVEFCICLLLTILGYVPGIIYAFYAIVFMDRDQYFDEYRRPLYSAVVDKFQRTRTIYYSILRDLRNKNNSESYLLLVETQVSQHTK
ncbi:uncharacterized protein LOC122306284 [Carya illinoinensis]|uniref:uncharacterized protein LOC122306284 n=1 Tax=Carya illinoinensis TaxID=32201 RepID=UPI001C719428|nr:uncharacterized protein LOC122306284 [Carya illinoinensis]